MSEFDTQLAALTAANGSLRAAIGRMNSLMTASETADITIEGQAKPSVAKQIKAKTDPAVNALNSAASAQNTASAAFSSMMTASETTSVTVGGVAVPSIAKQVKAKTDPAVNALNSLMTAPSGATVDVNGVPIPSYSSQIHALSATVIAGQYTTAGLNLFNKDDCRDGYEIYYDGTQNPYPGSTISHRLYVAGEAAITVSGLQSNPQSPRYYRLETADYELISVGSIPASDTGKTITIPAGAAWLTVAVRQRNPNTLNVAAVMVQRGPSATAWQAFASKRIIGIFDSPIYQPPLPVITAASGKNKLDPAKLLGGTEVYGDGSLLPQADSVAIDGIAVTGGDFIAMSGMQPNPQLNRYYAFLSAAGAVIAVGSYSDTGAILAVPFGASTFRASIKQRNPANLDISQAQIELSASITPYTAHEYIISSIDGINIAPALIEPTRSYGSLLAFGDSITETSMITDAGVITPNLRDNWPKWITNYIGLTGVTSYAKSGASFREYSGQQTWQKLAYQVDRAIAHGISGDIIVVAAGTNDGTAVLGDYSVAMGKSSLAALDKANTAEAMRWVLWSIKLAWPNAVCFYSTPLQRADKESADVSSLIELATKLAKRYGFIVIDAHNESGIIKDFEVNGAQGRHLYDGLHPSASGQKLQAKLIAARILGNVV